MGACDLTRASVQVFALLEGTADGQAEEQQAASKKTEAEACDAVRVSILQHRQQRVLPIRQGSGHRHSFVQCLPGTAVRCHKCISSTLLYVVSSCH
jgi:hypothetical protein